MPKRKARKAVLKKDALCLLEYVDDKVLKRIFRQLSSDDLKSCKLVNMLTLA